jgi:hypothetical protein
LGKIITDFLCQVKITLPLNIRYTFFNKLKKITFDRNLLMMLARWSGRRSGISFWISLSDMPLAEALARAKILRAKFE